MSRKEWKVGSAVNLPSVRFEVHDASFSERFEIKYFNFQKCGKKTVFCFSYISIEEKVRSHTRKTRTRTRTLTTDPICHLHFRLMPGRSTFIGAQINRNTVQRNTPSPKNVRETFKIMTEIVMYF